MKHRTPAIFSYLLPGFGDILWMSAFFGAISLGPRMMNIDGDLGRHLTIGRYILDQGKVPINDIFSHTMYGQPVTPHEWLSQVVFALADRLLGLDGVVIACALTISTSFWLVFYRARKEGQSLLPAIISVVLALAASSLHWLTRPHLFTFLLLALWMIVLKELRTGHLRQWWLMPVLMLVWANMHGAFIAGFVTWAIFGLGLLWDSMWHRFSKGESLHGHFWRYYLVGGVAALLATLINPSGIELWKTSIGYVRNSYLVGHTMEYLPPNFHEPGTWPFLIFIGLILVVLGLRNKRIEAAALFPTTLWLLMALYSARNIPLFVIIAAPLLAQGVEDILHFNPHHSKGLNRFQDFDTRLLKVDTSLRGILWPVACLVLVIIGLRAGVAFDFERRGNTFDPVVFPVKALDWVEDHPQKGNTFNYFTWGGYILYRQWPETRVFIDGQTDFYGERLSRQYEQVITLSTGWQEVLASYQVSWAILPPGNLADALLKSGSGWETVYQDETALVLVNR